MPRKPFKALLVVAVIALASVALSGCAQSASSSRSDSAANALVNKDNPSTGGKFNYGVKIPTHASPELTSSYNLYAIYQNSNVEHAVVQDGISSSDIPYITYNTFVTTFPKTAKDQEALIVDLFHRMNTTTYVPLGGVVSDTTDGSTIQGWCIALIPGSKWSSNMISNEGQQSPIENYKPIADAIGVNPSATLYRICILPADSKGVQVP